MTRVLIALLAAALTYGAPASAINPSKEELDAEVREAVAELYKHSSAAKELAPSGFSLLVITSASTISLPIKSVKSPHISSI